MASRGKTLSILLFPFLAQGHMLPMLDMAKLFALRGARTTFVTTPANAPLVQSFIDRAAKDPILHPIQLQLIPFPSGTGLPDGCENVSSIPTQDLDPLYGVLLAATARLIEPFGRVLSELLPDCVVTDMFYPWTYEAAAELGIPRLVFYGNNFFFLCISYVLYRYKPLESLPAEADTLVIPGLPHRIEMLKSQIPKLDGPMEEFFGQMQVSESKSYGVVVNSFYELEPEYAQYYRSVAGRRAWHIGPLALCSRDNADGSARDNCLQWLDTKRSGSVLYVCFGSTTGFSAAQLREMAEAFEAADRPFIWVVREEEDGNEWFPGGSEKGLVIRGWAPQIPILNHPSVGGFVTHCGWNSSIEAVSAGLPLVTWPTFADQFYNEKLIVDVLKIGVSAGVKEHMLKPEERELVEAATIKEAVDEVMGSGEKAEERRRRARELGETARLAVETGGSSYVDLSNLIQELLDKKMQFSDISVTGDEGL